MDSKARPSLQCGVSSTTDKLFSRNLLVLLLQYCFKHKFQLWLMVGLMLFADLILLLQPVYGRNQASQSIKVIQPELNHKLTLFILTNPQKKQINLSLIAHNQVAVPTSPLLAQTSQILRQQWQIKLVAAVNQEKNLTREAFRQLGIKTSINWRQKFALNMTIKPQKTANSVISLLEKPQIPQENIIAPSNLSGWLNISFIEDIYWTKRNDLDPGLQPLQINFDSAINYQGWVLENKFALVNSDWERRHTSIVKDDPGQSLRYILGDFFRRKRGWQKGDNLVGFTMVKNFALQPHRYPQPVGEYELFLASASEVDVKVNGNHSKTLHLDAGRHQLRDFPLKRGINTIEVLVKNEIDESKTIKFEIPYDGTNLAAGVEEFAYSLGFPAVQIKGEKSYQLDRPTLSFFHRSGLNNSLTLAGYGQIENSQQLLGMEVIWATPVGNWQLDTAMSNFADGGIDYAFKLNYLYQKNAAKRQLFNVGVQYRGKNFVAPGETNSASLGGYKISVNYRQTIWSDVDFQVGLNYQFAGEKTDRGDVSLSLSKPLSRNIQGSLTLKQKFTNDSEEDDFSISLNLSSNLTPKRRSSKVAINPQTQTNQIVWQNPNSNEKINTTATSFLSPSRKTFNSNVEYRDKFAQIKFSHNLGASDQAHPQDISSRLQLATAIVFADGHWGITRPVQDSFVLVVPRQKKIAFNPFVKFLEKNLNKITRRILPHLKSYQLSAVNNLDNYSVLPSYKSGTVIEIETDSPVTITRSQVNRQMTTTLFEDLDWQLLALLNEPIGKLRAKGFQGDLSPEEEITIQFTIAQDKTSFYDIRNLQLNPQQIREN